MNTALRLAQIALQAQGVVLRGRVRAAMAGAVFGAGAAVFALAALGLLHAAALAGLLEEFRFWQAALLLAAIDLVLALILALVARSVTRRRMRRAVGVRDSALSAVLPALNAGAVGAAGAGSMVKMAMGAGLLGLLASRLR